MFNGTNPSGRRFEVIDRAGLTLGAFDDIAEAAASARTTPAAKNIRRDTTLHAADHASNMAAQRERMNNFTDAFGT